MRERSDGKFMAGCEGCKVLFGSKIISCSNEESFGGLLSRLEERFSETPVQKIMIQDDKGQSQKVQLDAPLALCSPERLSYYFSSSCK